MAEEKDSSDKTEDPSQYRMEEFRKKGDVASSKELASVLVLAGTMLSLAISIVFVFETLHELIEWLYTFHPNEAFEEVTGKKIFYKCLWTLIKCVAPVFIASVCMGVFSQVIQFGFLYAPEVLSVKLDRVNPMNGFKRLFSIKSVAEVVKGVFKFSIVILITYYMMRDEVHQFTGFFHSSLSATFVFGKSIVIRVCFSIIAGLGGVALLDFGWEKLQHKQKLRQSKQELREELKEKEGNPEIKQRIKSIQREMAQKRMMQEVPKADVIVTNPTHISVAIRYDSKKMISPTVTALGTDHLALKIRELAKKHDVPLVENVPLARALYKTVKIGEGVPRSLYKAVAEVLAFVYRLNRKKNALKSGAAING